MVDWNMNWITFISKFTQFFYCRIQASPFPFITKTRIRFNILKALKILSKSWKNKMKRTARGKEHFLSFLKSMWKNTFWHHTHKGFKNSNLLLLKVGIQEDCGHIKIGHIIQELKYLFANRTWRNRKNIIVIKALKLSFYFLYLTITQSTNNARFLLPNKQNPKEKYLARITY